MIASTIRWAVSWVLWWLARSVILRIAEKTGSDHAWILWSKLLGMSQRVQGESDRGPWESSEKRDPTV